MTFLNTYSEKIVWAGVQKDIRGFRDPNRTCLESAQGPNPWMVPQVAQDRVFQERSTTSSLSVLCGKGHESHGQQRTEGMLWAGHGGSVGLPSSGHRAGLIRGTRYQGNGTTSLPELWRPQQGRIC